MALLSIWVILVSHEGAISFTERGKWTSFTTIPVTLLEFPILVRQLIQKQMSANKEENITPWIREYLTRTAHVVVQYIQEMIINN